MDQTIYIRPATADESGAAARSNRSPDDSRSDSRNATAHHSACFTGDRASNRSSGDQPAGHRAQNSTAGCGREKTVSFHFILS